MSRLKKSLILLLVLLAMISSIILFVYNSSENEKLGKEYIKNIINSYKTMKLHNNDINFKAEYPFFDYEILDKEIQNIIQEKENTNITYKISNYNPFLSILFIIENDEKKLYKNIFLDIKNEILVDKNSIFDFQLLGNEVLDRIKKKYSTNIYKIVVQDEFKNTAIDIEKNSFKVLFNDLLFNVNYNVYVVLGEESKTAMSEQYDKVISFTFDDGPSDYTKDITDTLSANSSEATFFELGNKMKYNQEIVRYLIDNNMEIGSHTYSHKNLNSLTLKSIEEELNSANIIFNEITDKYIELTRTPYGNATESIKKIINTPIIYWNVDTNDWLYRDANRVAKHILDNVKDGDIILMHDTYPETLETLKLILPELKEKGYKITTVSQLAKEKNVRLIPHEVYSSFN